MKLERSVLITSAFCLGRGEHREGRREEEAEEEVSGWKKNPEGVVAGWLREEEEGDLLKFPTAGAAGI